MIKNKFIQFYKEVARSTSHLSYARRTKVGAIIVKDDRIISYGYNGTPAGEDNNCEYLHSNGYDLVTKDCVIHAEDNALRKLEGEDLTNASIFITLAPCINCAKLIINSGITNLYYEEIYRSLDGLHHLEKNSAIIIQKI